VFGFLCLLTILFFFLSFYSLPAVKPMPVSSRLLTLLSQRYHAIFKTPLYKTYLACSVFAIVILMAFVTGSPYLLMKSLHQTPREFSGWFALNALVLMAASYGVSRLSQKFSPRQLLLMGSSFAFFGSASMLLLGITQVWQFMLPMFVVSLGLACLMPASMSAVMQLFSTHTASVSALTGCMRYLAATLVAFLVVVNVGEITMVLPALMLCASLVIFYLLYRSR